MDRTVALLLSLLSVVLANKDYGAPGWTCDPSLMKKSTKEPTSVHSLRYADIDLIAALGDSLTAANGAGANSHDPLEVMIQYRGLAFSMGGDYDLDTHVTLSNILKKFNPDVFGWSKGTGPANVWENSALNAAVPGAVSGDLVAQATELIQRMKDHPEVDVKNDWKLVHIFIGGNDICAWCDDPIGENADNFAKNIGDAVQVLKDNLPKTIVVLVGMLDISLLRTVDNGLIFCDDLHVFECSCEQNKNFSNAQLSAQCHAYMDSEQSLQDGRFEAEDFTLVIQPFFENLTQPPLLPDGSPDLSFFAPDCFHFSEYGHAVVAKNLWNNLNQPIGTKSTVANLTNPDIWPLVCPDPSCPFIRTTKNSVDCTPYLTD